MKNATLQSCQLESAQLVLTDSGWADAGKLDRQQAQGPAGEGDTRSEGVRGIRPVDEGGNRLPDPEGKLVKPNFY